MSLSKVVAQHILDVTSGGNWTDVSLESVLKDVPWKDAIEITNASPNSIASLVNHIWFYNEVVRKRIQGIETEISVANGFDLNPIRSEADWVLLRERMDASTVALASEVEKLADEVLFKPVLPGYSTCYKTLHGLVEHTHYHLGQIVIIKNLITNQKKQE